MGFWIIGESGSGEQNTFHIMDGNSRIATRRLGDDLGDVTPEIKYNLEDHLGSSNLMLSTDGAVVSEEEYTPFGETSFGSYGKKRYRFCGKEKDEESGLYYYGMRYYSAWTCRFVNVDPLAAKTPIFSPYCYANCNPIMMNDPTGGEAEGIPEGGGGGVPEGAQTLEHNPQRDGGAEVSTLPATIENSGGDMVELVSDGGDPDPEEDGAGGELEAKTTGVANIYIYSDVNKKTGEAHFTPTEMNAIKDNIQKIYDKNKVAVTVSVISKKEAQTFEDNSRSKQEMGDAFVMYTKEDKGTQGSSTVAFGDSIYKGTVNINASYVSYGNVESLKEKFPDQYKGRDMSYHLAYLGAHEALHQFLEKASLSLNNERWHPYSDGHSNNAINLNMEGTNVFPSIPKQSSPKLAQAETIPSDQKALINSFFDQIHEIKNPTFYRNFRK